MANSAGVPLSVSFDGDDYGPNLLAEDKNHVFFDASIPGPGGLPLRNRYYLQRRRRPMVPAASSTPSPEHESDPEKSKVIQRLHATMDTYEGVYIYSLIS